MARLRRIMASSQSARPAMRGARLSALCAGPVSRSTYPLNSELLTCHERRFVVLRNRMRFASSLSRSSKARPSATCSCREVVLWRRESFVKSVAKGKGKSPARLRHGRSEPLSFEIITRRSGRVIEGNTPRMMKFRNVFLLAENARGYQQLCLDMQGLPNG